MLYSHVPYHNDTINKQTQEDFFIYIYTSFFICKGSKRVTQGLRVRGSWRPNRNCNILTSTLISVNVVSFSFFRCSTGGPGVHSAGWWLSLLHLIRIFSGSQLIRAPSPFGLVWLSLPHLVYNSVSSSCCNWLELQLPWLLSWLSYIIVQRPLDRPLDLWNRMFNRHQAEITVMQFTGHSLPVHQSMSVPWEFFTSSHFLSQRDFLF